MALCCVETDQSGTTNIVKLPLAFVRSGYVSTNGSGAYNIGDYLYGWSRVAGLTPTAYGLGVNSTGVDPSNNYNGRWYGFPLRCLYLGSV